MFEASGVCFLSLIFSSSPVVAFFYHGVVGSYLSFKERKKESTLRKEKTVCMFEVKARNIVRLSLHVRFTIKHATPRKKHAAPKKNGHVGEDALDLRIARRGDAAWVKVVAEQRDERRLLFLIVFCGVCDLCVLCVQFHHHLLDSVKFSRTVREKEKTLRPLRTRPKSK